MPESQMPPDSGQEITTHFVRHRNVLLARAVFSELYVDYYLHLADHGLRADGTHDVLFKDTLAAFALHCASRPKNETIAWTIHFQEPFVNIFLGGDTEDGTLTGRIFSEEVKQMDSNRFYADVSRPGRELQRSVVSFAEGDGFKAVEAFYSQSEQRPARCFKLAEEEHAIAFAHPDCDMEWFTGLTSANFREITEAEILVPMERRRFRWSCGCNVRRIFQVLAPMMRRDPDDLFGPETEVQVKCPRCAAKYSISKPALEAFIADGEK